jgi:hypothetical protein
MRRVSATAGLLWVSILALRKTPITLKTNGAITALNLFTDRLRPLKITEEQKTMRRNHALALVFVVAAALTGCSTADNTNNSNANSSSAATPAASPQRQGVIETNANIPQNANSKTVPSNTGVVTNDNGNANTAGVRPINSNNRNRNANGNKNNNR